MIFESQYKLNQCRDKITVLLGRGEDFHTGAMFEIHPFPFLSLLIFTSRFVDQSHARLALVINSQSFPSTHVRTGMQVATPLIELLFDLLIEVGLSQQVKHTNQFRCRHFCL